ncbi:exo-alpha-sialidase [Auraticoccus sp. F435]|uniref:Exo-alpha-sialidase n=1 Tax=Auraticoccus cholistanensis TaxID=2656650 RepID=A0A6A9UUF9_9ACTN|nr:sialidase family protein [Auraticoccus cholistanensis]MVA76556.1 exo-alpha-sialidase [Auraticoccus cholistanensis]
MSHPTPRRLVAGVLALATASSLYLATSAAAAPEVPPGRAENGARLTGTVAMYPRAIRLEHDAGRAGTVVASVVTFEAGHGIGAIFESTDAGRSWTRIGSVADPGAREGLCCGSIFELPQQVGELAPGTLLWSASVGQDAGPDRRMTLPLHASEDGGRTWRKLATIATSPNFGGLWEPELSVSRDGRLVMQVSDESQQPRHSQTLVQATSSDGVSWSALENVVAADDPALRPGMPVTRRLPDGQYLMSFEVCGPGQECQHRFRRSRDGVRWGEVSSLGRPLLAEGRHQFRHAPTISLYDDGTEDGRLLAVGQMLYDRDGQVAEGNGSTIMVNEGEPLLPWRLAEAPVRVSEPYNNYCPNYSSSLLPLPERDELLELATAYDDAGVCTTYVAVGPLPD